MSKEPHTHTVRHSVVRKLLIQKIYVVGQSVSGTCCMKTHFAEYIKLLLLFSSNMKMCVAEQGSISTKDLRL